MAFQMNNGFESDHRPMSEINVTPFVDVMLVLLVIFMVTAPMMVQGLDVDLPKANAPAIDQKTEELTLTLTKDERVKLGDVEIPKEKLALTLKSNQKLKADKKVLLHADKGLQWGFVAQIMSLLKEAGIENVGMVTEPGDKID